MTGTRGAPVTAAIGCGGRSGHDSARAPKQRDMEHTPKRSGPVQQRNAPRRNGKKPARERDEPVVALTRRPPFASVQAKFQRPRGLRRGAPPTIPARCGPGGSSRLSRCHEHGLRVEQKSSLRLSATRRTRMSAVPCTREQTCPRLELYRPVWGDEHVRRLASPGPVSARGRRAPQMPHRRLHARALV